MGAASRRVSARHDVAVTPARGASATPRPPHAFVPRARLDSFLDGVPTTPVSLMVAPAGSGKTAAAAAWSERAADAGGAPVTWLRPDGAEPLGRHLEAARGRGGAEAAVLVIDDAHLLPEDATQLLTSVLEDDPDAVRLLLLSRRQLDFVPVSVALAGKERALRVDELRFTEAEAAELVRAHHPEVDESDVSAVLDQSDGWAAALVLGARALRSAVDSADARSSLAATRQPLLDFLLHEVFDTLPADLVRVLLTTCQEDHVTADQAVLLSGIPDAPALLGQAAAAGLLVTRYRDEEGRVEPGWRYHPLLLDLLRQRTGPTGPDWPRVVEAHHRATEVYIDRRDPERAVRHARLTGDLDLQLRVLREFAVDLMSRGRTDVVVDALADIPLDIRSRHQELLVLQAAVLRSQHRVDAAKLATDRALTADSRSLGAGLPRDVEAQLALLELWQARYGWRDPAPAVARAERALGCRHDARRGVDSHDLVGVSPLKASWLMLELAALEGWLGTLDRATVHVQDVELYTGQVDLPLLERSALSLRAMLDMAGGAYQGAMRAAEASLALWHDGGGRPDVMSARAHLALGWGRFHELDLEGAAECLAALDDVPGDALDPFLLVYRQLLRAGTLTAVGEVEEARRIVDAPPIPGRLPAYAERHHRIIRLLADAYLGDLQGMRAEASGMRAAGWGTDADLALALAVGLGGDEPAALRILDTLLAGPASPGTTGAAIARAAFLLRLGSPETVALAEQSVADVLSRVAPQRLLWILAMGVLVTPAFVGLVVRHADGPSPHPFARQAADALTAHPRPYPDVTPHRPGARAAGALAADAVVLTPRELEVLQQLALGGGNADLARSLFVSENTVKTHLASIYRKLDVDRRVDALRVARTRGLL